MKAGRREWIGLAVLALPCVLYSMDLTVLNLAVPSLSAALRPGAAELLWIVDIYGFLVAGSLITMGTLGDRIGRRRLLLVGAGVFGIASALAAFSGTPAQLIATRALMGVAAATLAPSTLSLIRNMFHDPHERTVAISVWIMSYSAGAAIGPVIGGLLLEHFWWGSVFLINVPVMLLLLAIAPVLLPEFRDPRAGRIDLPSAAQSLAAILSVIYGLKHLAEGGGTGLAVASIGAGLAIGFAFVRRQARLADPLVDLRLFRSPAFGAALAVNLLGFMTAFATFLFVAQYLQSVLGLSPMQAGLWGLPAALAFIAGSMMTPRIVRRFAAMQVIAGGMLVSAAGFVILAQAGGAASPLALLFAAQLALARGVPLIGVNRGRLGFLTDVLPDDMLASVDDVLAGRYEIDRRQLLQARLAHADGTGRAYLALNDVVVQRQESGRMVELEVWIDGGFVNTHGGDGLVIATSTGSTAYALSCGGPIIHPALGAVVIAPISPHTLSDRPIVLGRDSAIEIRLVARSGARAQVTCDGAVLGGLATDSRLEIGPAPGDITLLHPPGHDYFRLLRSKLHWGRSGRSGGEEP